MNSRRAFARTQRSESLSALSWSSEFALARGDHCARSADEASAPKLPHPPPAEAASAVDVSAVLSARSSSGDVSPSPSDAPSSPGRGAGQCEGR